MWVGRCEEPPRYPKVLECSPRAHPECLVQGHGQKGVSRVQRCEGLARQTLLGKGEVMGKRDLRDRAVNAEGLGRRACMCSRLRPSRRQRRAHVPQAPVELSEHV